MHSRTRGRWSLSGHVGVARSVLLASLKLNPEQFEARLALGRVYLGLKDLKAGGRPI